MSKEHNDIAEEVAKEVYAAEYTIMNEWSGGILVPWKDLPPDAKESQIERTRSTIFFYEDLRATQHARALAILRRIVNGPRPAHGSLDAWDEAAKLLREVDGGVIKNG